MDVVFRVEGDGYRSVLQAGVTMNDNVVPFEPTPKGHGGQPPSADERATRERLNARLKRLDVEQIQIVEIVVIAVSRGGK